jgi:hypothetical protein
MRMGRWSKRRIVGIGILALAVNAILLFLIIPSVASRFGVLYNNGHITDGYDLLANNLASGKGYRFYPDTSSTLMREPGYPVVLAGLILVFGTSFTVVKIFNMILTISTAWIVMKIAGEIVPEPLAGDKLLFLAPPLLFLFHPGVLMAEDRGGVEMLFTLLISLFLLSVLRAIKSNRVRDFAVSGLILGMTVAVRSTPMLFPLFLLGYLLWFERRRMSIAGAGIRVAALIAAMFAVLSPWIIRNYSLTGKFVPSASVFGVSAQAGQYINTHLFEGRPFWMLDREASRERDKVALRLGMPFEDGAEGYYQTFYKTEDELKFSSYLFGDVVKTYKASPMLALRCLGQNILNFWFAGKTWTATALNAVVQIPYLLLALLGAIPLLKSEDGRKVGLILLFVGYVFALHVAVLAQARYSIPLIPFISILATVGIVSVRGKVTGASRTTVVGTAKVVAN